MPSPRYLTDRYTGRALIPNSTPARGDQDCECPPPCPSCGGLECLCRPRFFAGQVLTEVDLNRLENYFIAKNKLHNRHFHGSGVVCGLEVVCDPCDPGSVIVNNGYALAPCGDDIIVCNPARAPICDLIRRCRPPDQDCDPYGAQQPTQCLEGIRQFVLSICYDEKPSRGVQPLMSEPCSCGGNSCGCGCGGGGGGSCGCGGKSQGGGSCGCGGKSSAASTRPAKSLSASAKKYNPQCEPTLICEGFKFTATKYVDRSQTNLSDYTRYGKWGMLAAKAEQFGPLLTRLLVCYLKTDEIGRQFVGVDDDPQRDPLQLATAYAEYRDALRELAAEHVTHRCELLRELSRLEAPAPGQGRTSAVTRAAWQAAFQRLREIGLELFRECFCSALLPPCPEIESSNCVPLAVVTVDATNCRVLEICNWRAREFAMSLTTLYYWTSFLNWGSIKDGIAKLCCDPVTQRWSPIFRLFESIVANNTGSNQNAARGAAGAPGASTGQPNAQGPLDSQIADLTLKALSGMVEQTTMPDGMARLLSIVHPPAAPQAADVTQLNQTIQSLQRQVDEHREMIRRLMENR